jgi:predicted TIM-barrel fold metal-dependent hydrolase
MPMLRTRHHDVEAASVPAIDVHNHLGRWLSADGAWMVRDPVQLMHLMDELNIAVMVNLDGRWGAELDENLIRYDHAHPGRFATFCHIDWRDATREGFTERMVSSLRASAGMGAKGLKVWKDLGFEARDPNGALLLIDDPRLGEVWDASAELELPVLVHTADPAAFFRPVDNHNERLEELTLFPRLARYGTPGPSLERLLEAFETVVARHPRTTFIGAHLGGAAEDLEWVSRLASAYPNLVFDIAARLSELGRQPRAARALIEAHPDRILFGTDIFPPRAAEYRCYLRFLETDDEHFAYSSAPRPLQGRWSISGLGLPREYLDAIYRENACRVIPALRSHSQAESARDSEP